MGRASPRARGAQAKAGGLWRGNPLSRLTTRRGATATTRAAPVSWAAVGNLVFMLGSTAAEPEHLRVVSVFSGIAGLDSGLEAAGHTIVEMCESWEPARRVLEAHFPHVHVHPDVRTYTPQLDYDVLAAGFPCTDLSQMGRRAGIFGKDTGLVRHVFRIADATKPPWIVLENVPNLLTLHAGAGMKYVTSELDRLGYRWAYRTVDSRFTGVPQRRPRVLLLASRASDPAPALLDEDLGPATPVAQPDTATAHGFYWTEGRHGLGLVGGSIPTLKGGSTIGLPSAPAVWVPDNPNGTKLLLPSIEDGEALQGFPRGWTEPALAPGERDLRWKLVGNAVTVGVGQWIGELLAACGDRGFAPRPTAVAIDVTRRWPTAGWGAPGEAWASTVSAWPRRPDDPTSLIEALRTPTPLSHRATRGFLSRLDESARRVPAAFYRDLEQHLAHTRPPLPPARSRASSDGNRQRKRAQRQVDTRPEVALRRILHSRGLRYRLQMRPSIDLRRRVDIAFPIERIAVDVRSCFWHRCPAHATAPSANAERWADKVARNVERDADTVDTLTRMGWHVVIVWEHDDLDEAADRIENAVRARRKSGARNHETSARD